MNLDAIFWFFITVIAITLYLFTHPKLFNNIVRTLEVGQVRMAYAELLAQGAITQKEYLTIMKEVKKKYE